MAYSNFTLDTVLEAFDLEEVDAAGIFAASEPVKPSELLTTVLERNVPLAFAIGTEKAKSELIVAFVLVELREHFDRRISFFSGIDFNVDAEYGLTGGLRFFGKFITEAILFGSPGPHPCRKQKGTI